jgi:hypothetical protein
MISYGVGRQLFNKCLSASLPGMRAEELAAFHPLALGGGGYEGVGS